MRASFEKRAARSGDWRSPPRARIGVLLLCAPLLMAGCLSAAEKARNAHREKALGEFVYSDKCALVRPRIAAALSKKGIPVQNSGSSETLHFVTGWRLMSSGQTSRTSKRYHVTGEDKGGGCKVTVMADVKQENTQSGSVAESNVRDAYFEGQLIELADAAGYAKIEREAEDVYQRELKKEDKR